MISVEQAWKMVLDHAQHTPLKLPFTPTSYQNPFPGILREDICADRDLPPYDRVMMDGIAVALSHGDPSACQRFKILGRALAGEEVQSLPESQSCLEVMTGSILPTGAQAVVPLEYFQRVKEGSHFWAVLHPGYEVKPGQFVHRQGSDATQGSLVLPKGTFMGPNQWGIAAAVGASSLLLSRPKVGIVATGSEIVAVETSQPGVHQIRNSNPTALLALLQSHGFTCHKPCHVPDDPSILAQEVQDQLSQSHVLILTGGVSAGSADYVPAILRELGVTQVFHKVSQKPGKPLWFGVGPLGQLVFGLPGNPVSCMVTALKYVIPALRFLQFGKLPGSNMVPLLPGQQAPSHSHLTLFASVQLTPTEEGALAAHILPQNNSGDFVSLLKSDGVVEIPPGRPNSDGFSYMSWLKNSSLF